MFRNTEKIFVTLTSSDIFIEREIVKVSNWHVFLADMVENNV